MVLAHLFLGVLVGFIAGVWGWFAGLPVWAALCLYVLGGVLGVATSATVMILFCRQASAARKAEATVLETRSQEGCPTCEEAAIPVIAAENQRKAPGRDPSGR